MSKFKPNQDVLTAVKPVAQRPAYGSKPARTVEQATKSSPSEPIRKFEAAPPSAVTRDEEAETEPSVFSKLGFGAVLCFIFFRFSYIHEFVSTKLGLNLHLIIIIGSLCYLGCLFSGRATLAFRDKITWLWIGFAIMVGLASVASYWKGGSLPLVLSFLDSSLPIIVVIPSLVRTRKQVGQAIGTIGLACMAMLLLGALNKDFKAGRMNINAAGSDIQDPNDYAAHVILMLPALAWFTLRKGRNIFSKVLGVGFVAVGLQQILSTGSRGGLTSLALTTLFVLLVGSRSVKAALLVGIPVLALLAIPFIPSMAFSRLGTVFSGNDGPATEATESTEQRWALLRASVQISLEHPFLGVGPGVFMDYQADQAKLGGGRGLWHVTHNSYTEVSSECGLIAFALYAAALVLTFRSLRRANNEDRDKAGTLLVMQVGFGTCMLFLSMAYNVHMLVISGLAIALVNAQKTASQRVTREEQSNDVGAVLRAQIPA